MRTFNTILACFIVSFIHINFVFSNAPVIDENGCEISIPVIENNTIRNTLFYPSGNQEGLIGRTKDKPVDNPADNVFHVALDEIPGDCQQIWLEYELYGVQDHTAVSRSINDQLSAGGYLVQTNEKWTTQKELVRIDWLKQGNNVIRFAVPKGASYSYRVRNLGLRVTEVESEQAPNVIIQNADGIYYKNKAYVKGFVDAKDKSTVSVCVDGEEVVVADGEFEILVNKPETRRTWWFQKAEKKWSVEVEVAYPSGEVKYETVRFDQAEKADFSRNLNKKINYTEKLFSTKTAQQIQLQSAVLNVPADALESEEIISITALRTVDIPALNPGMVNVTSHDDAYRMLPHGTQFKKPVELTLKYDKSKIPSGYTEADIRTFYFDEITHNWVPIPRDSVDAATGRIFSRTTHFTDYINGVIQVPESPETNAYTPTSIKDIKAANPSAAINEIQPPSANNTGTANLSYPINIPAGRQGMQPSVGIQYNSGGGNGWLGLGWDLSVPAITIETRWGVPRFDGTNETETYSMMGQMLWPVAHRDTPVARTGDAKQFYPRVEGSFNRIIRHGDSPTNYYWEVTDKSGTTYFYGGVDDVDDNAVLRDASNNIGHWALVEMRDLNDNFVRYHHAIQNDVGIVGGSVMGQNLYCESITYTGHGNTEGRYSVVFTRDRELGENKRTDVQIDARLAFKRVTADLLRKVEVQLDDTNIRSYELHYQEGAFYKTLLDSIVEFDAAGNRFVGHTFDYFDDVQSSLGYAPLYGSESWNPGEDAVSGTFINPISAVGPFGVFDDKASALNGSKSLGGGAGIAITAGPINPLDPKLAEKLVTKSNSAGVAFNFALSKNDGLLALVDINGDGLPDKVFKDLGLLGINNGLYFRPNESGPDGTTAFGEPQPIIGINNFSKGKSTTFDIGVESHFGIFAGAQYSRTKNKTTIYFADVNGDQLIDIVNNKTVYFNHLDADGNPTFTASSIPTPSPIVSSGNIDPNLVTTNPDELEQAIDQNPLHDVVRVWEAPYDGMVSITNDVQLIESTDEDRAGHPADGVRVAIQHEDAELWSETIDADDYTAKTPTGVDNITVLKGDQIYFRVQSVFDGLYDQVEWLPSVTYTDHTADLNDANGIPIYQFNAGDDFLLSAPMSAGMPIDGTIDIIGNFKKPITSDDISVQIIKESDGVLTTLAQQDFLAASTTDDPILVNPSVTVLKNDNIYFVVSSNTNVNWSVLEWSPHIYYTVSNDPDITQITDQNGNPVLEFFPTVDYQAYELAIEPSLAWTATADATVNVVPQFTLGANTEDGTITFSVKKENELIGTQTLTVTGGVLGGAFTAISADVLADEELFVEYHIDNELIAAAVTTANATISGASVTAGLHAARESTIFGPMYRQWGQFAYNGNRERADEPINQADLVLDESLSEPPEIDLSGESDADGMFASYDSGGGNQPNENKFIYMMPDTKFGAWRGYDDLTYVSNEVVSASRMGEDDILPFNPISNEPIEGTGAVGIEKISKTDNVNFSVGVGPAGLSTSLGSTKQEYDFMDMNGDRHPDILSKDKIQYSLPTGGLEAAITEHSFGQLHKSGHNSVGFSLGGTFPKSKPSANKEVPHGGDSSNEENTSKTSAGISGNFNANFDETDFAWMDINGDGLQDRVYTGGGVELNLGYSFAPEEQWGYDNISKGEAQTFGAGLNINFENYSLSVGVGLSRTDNETRSSLQDMNGDGLLDYVTQDFPLLSVAINTGNGFAPAIQWTGVGNISKGASTGESANAAFTGCIVIASAKLCFNPSVNISQGVSRQKLQISDIDGDGYPDVLESDNDDDLAVRLSTIDRTNLLRSVSRPLGADFEMDYTRVGNTYEMPNSIWTLSSVTINDGFAGDGADVLKNTFEYEDGFYERHEREFYGFKTIKTHQLDTENNDAVYRSNIQTFLNDNYYTKGLLVSDVLQDADGNLFTENINAYALKNIADGSDLAADYKAANGIAFPALTSMTKNFYEGQANAGESTGMTLEYDLYGNVTSYTDLGDTDASDDFTSDISYHEYTDNYIVGIPSAIMVSADGMTYRKRETTIDPATGNILQIRQFLEDNTQALHDMTYDQYGNLGTITRPENQLQERLAFTYEYDPEVHIYTEKVSDSYGYESTATYDYRFGQILENISMNGQPMEYTIDDVGRVTDITGPYEIAEGIPFTIHFDYFPDAEVPYALTQHYDPSHPDNFIETSTFIDGLSRPIQVKKDAAIYDTATGEDVEQMIISGRVLFDAFGRTTTAYYPTTEALGAKEIFNAAFDDIQPTATTFDVLDRNLTVTLPDSALTTTEYTFGADRLGDQQFMTIVTDANDIRKDNFTDVRGRATSLKEYLTGQNLPDIWTSYAYNAINELVEVTDDQDNLIVSEYDWFGRRTSVIHPDAGETTYTYDLASNMTEMVTANLRQSNQAITYAYEFERLTDIIYPNFTKNNVHYEYGDFGASDNRAGRIVTQEDASGIQEFFYGPLGETVKNIRQVNVPGKGVFTYTTEWEYDTWNRVKGMRYPDGEVLTYNYNVGGLLHSMSGEKDSTMYNYLTRLGYDEFEDRVYLSYGNGTETTYAYEADRRRLQNLVATTSEGRAMMDNAYEYDAVTNILSITNSAPVPSANQKGGPASYSFEYDDLYRLTSAEGAWEGANDDHDYTLNISYNSIHDITQKTQVHNKKGNEQKDTSYDFVYEYTSAQPHALTLIGGHKTYTYDANGNQTGWDSETNGKRRNIEWDEEDRINSISDQGKTYNYTYDAGGIRVLKGQGNGNMEVDVNGANAANGNGIGNYTMYVNPFVVAKGGGYTKHYFIESQRIVSKIGEGSDGVGDDNGNGNGGNNNDGDNGNGNGNNGNNGNGNGGIGNGDGQGQNNGNGNGVGNGDGNNGNGNNGNNGNDGNNGNGNNGNGNNGNGNNIEAFQYYYHPDHLGNTSYLTDASGEVYQHIEYTAFGETFVEERNNGNSRTPYLYNGKELDEETGLYYYGARYYEPMESRWLSVDPKAEKYPGWSPYNYTFNNPVIYADPDGRDGVLVVFPDYKVNTEIQFRGWKAPKAPLGHAGVLLIDNKTGLTKYYEYGRYATRDGTKGRVRKVGISNVKIDPKTGKPTQKSLNKVLGQISRKSGQGGKIKGAYVEGDFKTMNDYAQKKLKESNPQHSEYDKDREPYKLLSNSCGTFADDAIKQDKNAKKKAPFIINPAPYNIGEEYQDNFPKVDYNPKDKTTTSDIYEK